MEMNRKMFACLCFLGILFVFILNAHAKELDSVEVNKDFIDSLTLRNIGNLSIMIPNFLKMEPNVETNLINGSIVKLFRDDSKAKSIMVFIDKTPLSSDLRKVVSSQYEFHDKAFNPGINPVFRVWSNLWNSANGKTSRIDFGDFHGFLIKGTKHFYSKPLAYEYMYQLFRKGDDESLINIVIRSSNDYFLNDWECNYIVNTLREHK